MNDPSPTPAVEPGTVSNEEAQPARQAPDSLPAETGGEAAVPVDPAVGVRKYEPPASAESDRTYGIEYLILGLLLVGLVLVFSERAQKLLRTFYDPFVITLLIVVFVEYLILKARDRTYVLEREIELHVRKRREMQEAADACLREIDRELRESVAGASSGGEDERDGARQEVLRRIRAHLGGG